MKTESTSFNACQHSHVRHSPNGVDVIHECLSCRAAWIIKGITGEVIRLFNWKIKS